VECYEGIRPVGNTAGLWPSRYNCEELSCPTDSSPHQVFIECDYKKSFCLFFSSVFSSVSSLCLLFRLHARVRTNALSK
jgi:hypothetical protein